jgi:TetR/AcrR family transcriptional regulator, transcriptional repressor for nem operon
VLVSRYPVQHKDATRQRIVRTAARRLKADGVQGSGVSALMAGAGLTNGAFYVHFASKLDLVARVVGEELGAQRAAAATQLAGETGLAGLVGTYLSAEHRDHPGDGCPSAALIEEIARGDQSVREAYTRGIVSFVDVIAAHLDPVDPHTQQVRVLAAFAGMVGTLQMARTVTDLDLSDALLAQGVEHALLLLGLQFLPARPRLSTVSDPEASASPPRGEQS